jgi:carotenoid cleavage dioxygenase-like enzyme
MKDGAEVMKQGCKLASDDMAGNMRVSLIVGTIPPELTGSFYRVGAARIRVGKDRYAHWFDGDGFIFAVGALGMSLATS